MYRAPKFCIGSLGYGRDLWLTIHNSTLQPPAAWIQKRAVMYPRPN